MKTENPKKDNSSEFVEKKELIALDSKAFEERHNMKMKELGYIRATERLKHDWEMERNRIKSAEIRKSQMRKEQMKY